MEHFQVVNEESNETTVTRKQDKGTYLEDVADWVGNMLTNKYECSSKVTNSGRTMYNNCITYNALQCGIYCQLKNHG